MKSMLDQITLLDREVLRLFGIHGLTDYQSIVTVEKLESQPNFLEQLNQLLEKILNVFPNAEI